MSDKVTNELIFETLKRIQETLALHTQYHLETKERLGLVEYQGGASPRSTQAFRSAWIMWMSALPGLRSASTSSRSEREDSHTRRRRRR